MWGAWDNCSVTCGGGTQGREKIITQNATHGGNECEAPFTVTQNCNMQLCAGNLSLSEYIDLLRQMFWMHWFQCYDLEWIYSVFFRWCPVRQESFSHYIFWQFEISFQLAPWILQSCRTRTNTITTTRLQMCWPIQETITGWPHGVRWRKQGKYQVTLSSTSSAQLTSPRCGSATPTDYLGLSK